MYGVKQEKIEEILINLINVLDTIKPIVKMDNDQLITNKIYLLAIERAVHIAIESIVDVGNYLIDGFIMRDPGSYLDIIEIMHDEQVITKEESIALKRVVGWRKDLVNQYITINHQNLKKLLEEEIGTLLEFPPQVRSYLAKELN